MTALTRRYPCLYTTEARKHARNQRRLDGWLVVHHHNCSSTLWDEERRSQLRFGWLKAHPRRKVWDNGIGGLKCDFKLQEDEEIQLGDSHKVWITGGPVEESFQNIEHFSVMRSRKRSEVEAWRDEDPKAKESKKRRRTSSVSQSITATKPTSTPQSSRTPSGHTSAKQGTPLWRKSENAQIGISPYASPQTDAAPVKTIESDHVQPASRVRRAEVEDVEDVKPLSVASAVPHHLRQRKEMGSLGMGSPQCRPSTSAVPLVYKNASPTSSTSARSLSRHLPSQLLKPFKPPGRKMEP